MPYSLKDYALAPGVRERILKNIIEVQESGKGTARSNFPWNVSPFWLKLTRSLTLAIVLLLVFFNLNIRNKPSEKAHIIGSLEQQVLSARELMDFMENPSVEVKSLTSPMRNLKAHGKVFWNKRDKVALLYAIDLPVSVEGKTYQCWVMANDRPVSRGMIRVGVDGGEYNENKIDA